RLQATPTTVILAVVAATIFIALLISYPWYILSAGSLLYLGGLPIGWKTYRDLKLANSTDGGG
ncbi:hypothetical protein ABTK33_20360, partial [Acinetobacter baumannii]